MCDITGERWCTGPRGLKDTHQLKSRICERLAKAAWELEFASGKFDVELVNDKLEDTFAQAEAIVDAFLCG